ncbi:hypothetical protein G6706_08670 [Polynucleobacter paneuropaeus]|nr:hypothetical protein [Polynucleobacter paneuropaeus]MBT8555502.1 hypothetical protein [Polynucleobacter paneuropaeus]MBT8560778.1 hypothetical protein [Polynucleobacter paneuropaeus]
MQKIYLTQRNWASLSALSVFTLMFIWVLPNTIALRHFLLAIGVISGVFLIKENWSSFKSLKLQLIPLYSILGLFLWVGVHYHFFSLNPDLELREIKGLWARTFAGSIMAIGFGVALCQFKDLRKYFYIGVFAVPVINILAYIYDSYLHGRLINPNEFIFFLFAKIETAYFGGIAASVAVASIIYFIINSDDPKRYKQITLYVIGLLIVVIADVISNTKNGILIAMLIIFLLLMVVFAHALFFVKSKNNKFLEITVIVIVLLISGFVWNAQKQLASRGWDTIFQDTQLAMEIDKNTQWQYAEGSRPLPLNSAGLPPAVNTYSRVAWATVGVRLISQYPLGYGSVNQSFNGLQNYLNIYHEHTGQTHSGWIDFGLGFGLPGLFLIFLAIFSIIVLSLMRPTRLNLIAATICVMLLPFCLTSEMSYKQYFESMIFFLGMCGTIVVFSRPH